jgi:hypothetical protein
MSRTARAILIASILVGAATLDLRGQARSTAISAESLSALQYFLDVDCEIDGRTRAVEQLLKYKIELEPRLVTLLKEGPDQQALAEMQRGLEQRWSQREAFLRQDPKMGLTEEQLRLAKSVTKEAYINQGREQFVRKYRQKAAIGLAAIGSPEALKTLREVSAKADEDLREVIRAATARFPKK